MNLTEYAIEKRVVTYFAAFLLLAAGTAAFFSLGQLEDPDFTVKTAVVSTEYPGASPAEVELEVTDRIEQAIQELPYVDDLYSQSRPGMSTIVINIKEEYWADRLPQVWDEVRLKIRDVTPQLPPGAKPPLIMDDFGFVYGFVMAITGDGFSYAELEEYVKSIKKELSVVPGVARAEWWGIQDKCIYLDASQAQLSQLGLTAESVMATLTQQNTVVDAGAVDVGTQRYRIAITGSFESPEEIGELTVHPSLPDLMAYPLPAGGPSRSAELIRLEDVCEVKRGYLDPPRWLMRYNGKPALALSLANVAGGNIVDTGRAIDVRLDELIADLPIGIDVHKITWQSDLVSSSVNEFFINVVLSVVIVLVVLTIPMGLRMGIIIGTGLLFTILGTLVFMSLFGIDLQRISLGALVIALGMMVDNSIVIADGVQVRIRKGMDRKQAAVEAATRPALPLLGATIIATMAFYPIFASVANAGEYCQALFSVVAISLLFSWVVAMTLTPLQCIDMLPEASGGAEGLYNNAFYRGFRRLLSLAIRFRVVTIVGLLILLGASGAGFVFVKQMFFPDSTRLQFMVDYYAPEGTRIQEVAKSIEPIEAKLIADERVEAVSTFIGSGPPRFYLPVDPETPLQSYGQIIVNLRTLGDVHSLFNDMEAWAKENVPGAMVRVMKYGVGPFDSWKFEARFTGPANADLKYLRDLGEQGMKILAANPLIRHLRTDMRERVRKVVPTYDQERGRWAGISREDVARTTKWAHDGLVVGLYRERDDLYPILLRNAPADRETVAGTLDTLQVKPTLSTRTVPLAQVADVGMEWEDPIIVRSNRRRAVTVQGNPDGVTFPTLLASCKKQFEDIQLRPGYRLEWEGEYDSTVTAQTSLIPGCIPAAALILFILVALFNAIRPPLIILCTIPFAAIGITGGMLATGAPFGFVALLGAMSLSGMMIKNAIVLLDEIGLMRSRGKSLYVAIMDGAVSRLSPVVLAAGTTVLGVMPLLQDVFWVSMSVTIMAGLTFGTVLTMVVVPVLYATFHKVKVELPAAAASSVAGQEMPANEAGVPSRAAVAPSDGPRHGPGE